MSVREEGGGAADWREGAPGGEKDKDKWRKKEGKGGKRIEGYLPLERLGQRPRIIDVVGEGIDGIGGPVRRLAVPGEVNADDPETGGGEVRGQPVECVGVIKPSVQSEDRGARGQAPHFGGDSEAIREGEELLLVREGG